MKSNAYVSLMIIVALALGAVVVVDTIVIPLLEADAIGCLPGGTGFNASQGRCFRG
jgi:hypothetical protein